MRDFRKYEIWQSAMQITKSVYVLTKQFPDSEKYGLKSQLERAAVSIPSNIAEGAGRSSEKEFCHFLQIAQGSSYEVETQLLLAVEFDYVQQEALVEFLDKLHMLQRQVHHLIGKLK